MRRWIAGILVFLAVATSSAWALEDEAAKANALYNNHKMLEALPLYEDLVKAFPNEEMYVDRLAACLASKVVQLS
ncbi:MAG: hypothetical protein WB424_13835, partial [Terracidiphilus sp.]